LVVLFLPTLALLMAGDQRGELNEFQLAAYGTIALGLVALLMSVVVPFVVRRSRRGLALAFNPTVRIVTFAVGLSIILQGLLAAFMIYAIEVSTTNYYHPKIIIVVALAGLVAGLLVLRQSFAFFRAEPVATIGRLANLADYPTLQGRLKHISARLDAEVPQNIILGLQPNFYVTAYPIRLIPSGEILHGNTLYLSLALCRTFTSAEFEAVVGHEVGHFIGEDATYSRRFAPAYATLGRAIGVMEARVAPEASSANIFALPALLMLRLCMLQFAQAERSIGRQREFAADEVGARVAGPKALASALLKVGMYADLWSAVQRHNIEKLDAGNILQNLSALFAWASATTYEEADFSKLKSDIASYSSVHPFDTHPPTGQRIRRLGIDLDTITAQDLAVPQIDNAIELFTHVEAIEQELTVDEHRIMIASGRAILPDQDDQRERSAKSA
jgi:Zn-dependent protease with chaperone function